MGQDALKVDSDIFVAPGNWEFSAQVAPKFNSHVIKSVPYYLDTQVAVAEVSDWFVRKNSLILDLGCATGSTIGDVYRRHIGKNISIVGIDNSAPMLAEANKSLQGFRGIELIKADIETYNFPKEIDLILSLYTLQFVHPKFRLETCKKIYESLNPSGGFLLVEKVADEDSTLSEIFCQLHWQRKEAMGLSVEEIYGKAKSLRGVMVPLTLERNFAMLREAGFSKVGLFFKWFNFAGIVAIK
ncbi:methyltransferase domain-containing protein [Nostoc sp. DedQUE07]|uniref:methyltransferase domain-containing protein n=1 Tax=Nostoc sp. DedQUE07 TaxID=3075392 RepID=UPI002AD3E25B|nr:methyltransferase domain-containing protein [Nostoc sp. DedQUE07]MDZ8131882.1 methyltransferase domain-containing protein [Nostoc sp. DedQUE07]